MAQHPFVCAMIFAGRVKMGCPCLVFVGIQTRIGVSTHRRKHGGLLSLWSWMVSAPEPFSATQLSTGPPGHRGSSNRSSPLELLGEGGRHLHFKLEAPKGKSTWTFQTQIFFRSYDLFRSVPREKQWFGVQIPTFECPNLAKPKKPVDKVSALAKSFFAPNKHPIFASGPKKMKT